MQVTNKNSYISTIYSAIVVNTDSSLDPDSRGRLQIYIPSVNYQYADNYQEYIDDDDKRNNTYFSSFPWAITLLDELKNGDEVYGSYIDGDDTQYIILGLAGGKSNLGIGGANFNGSDIVNLTMPIILHNEIGVSISAWADDTIPDSKYKAITLHDGGEYDTSTKQWIKQGSWSIGLIQWNGPRAYDLCYNICKDNGNWRDAFSSAGDIKLRIDLTNSLTASSSNNQRGGYGSGYNPEKNGVTYNAILNLIGSESAKKTQKEMAFADTSDTINMLMDAGCNNPAILIYMADFYNQYGSGYPETTKKAVSACNSGGDMLQQLDNVIAHIKANFKSFATYQSRRNATYAYIKELYNAGKLNMNTLTDLGEDSEGALDLKGGTYCVPYIGSYIITAIWGKGGYSSGGYHTGVDFGCPSGTKLLACANGTISVLSDNNWNGKSAGYGRCLKLMTDDGYAVIYGHMSSFKKTSGRVSKGEVIGYSGYTGYTIPVGIGGSHLHFEIRKSPYRGNGSHTVGGGDDVDPLPFIGMKDRGRGNTVQGSSSSVLGNIINNMINK